jgi:nicotinamide-nucleotide amidase
MLPLHGGHRGHHSHEEAPMPEVPEDGNRPLHTDEERVRFISEVARARHLRIAAAESLTSGRISGLLGAGEGAADWYAGAVVAYGEDVKFRVLGVTPGPVVTDACAREMAEGVRRLLRADVAVGITGVGGPGPQEDCPPGTVHLAVADATGTVSLHALLPGDPPDVVAEAASLALDELVAVLRTPAPD